MVMKKVFSVLAAAAVAALGILSCSKEQMAETTPSEEGIQLNITVGQLDGTADPDTKAVKTGWASGDRINIWYDENISQNPDLVIAYDGSKWAVDHSAAVSGKMPAASGTLTAMYVAGGLADFSYAGEEGTCRFSAPRFSSVVDGANRPARMSLISYVDRTDYSFASDILTSNLADWLFRGTNVQVVISGLPAGEWALKCDRFKTPSSFNLTSNSPVTRVMVNTGSAAGNYALSVANADGRAFMYFCNGTDTDFNFTLFNTGTGEKLVYLVSGKSLDATGYKLNAIKIPFSKFSIVASGTAKRTGDIDVKWVQLWAGGPKFAEYNVGAENNKAEDYGGYYCWGSIDKDMFMAHKSGTVALSGTDDTATKLWGSAWRMPTKEEFDALLVNCDVEWTTVNGVNGSKLTGKDAYASNSVFLPAAGYAFRYDDVRDQGSNGQYWSSTPSNISFSYYRNFDSSGQHAYNGSRDKGRSVRAVLAE